MNAHKNGHILRAALPYLFAFWMALVVFLTLAPADLIRPAASIGNPGLVHVVLFGVWAFLFGMLIHVNYGQRDFPLWLIFSTGFSFGALIEILQMIMPFGRQASMADILLNSIGCLLAITALWIFRKYFSKRLFGN